MNWQKITKSVLIIIEAAILSAVLVLGVLTVSLEGPQNPSDNKNSQQIAGNTMTEDESESVSQEIENVVSYTEVRLTFSDEVEAKLASMTTEEKVAQLFLTSPEALTGVGPVTVSGNGTKEALNQYPVGGLLYNANNFMSTEQVRLLTGNAQSYSMERIGVPLFMAVAEEGGIDRSPLATVNLYNITMSPGELGSIGDAELVTSAVNSRMEYLTADGFNMVFGAMANLAEGEDPYQDDRTYGSDSIFASEMITADIAATNAANVNGILRYFPRQGDAGDFSKLTEEELNVFQAGIDAGANIVMVSHGRAKSITGDAKLPCCLAKGTVAYIRGNMGYEGVLITASLNDDRITSAYSTGDAAVRAIEAGMDMIFVPVDFVQAYEAVVAAVNDGTISQMRLDNAVGKVLEMKM